MSEESVIDRDVLRELLDSTGGDMEFLCELIDTYLVDSTELLAQMHRSLAANDVEGFRRAVHSLKSNSANFGAGALAGQARELEMMARAGSVDGAAAKLTSLEEMYGRVAAELARLRTAA